jgi:DNA primase
MTAVDEIKARLDIVDVVSEYVSLNKAGRNHKGVCPFHAEKTPSFFVFPDTQTWYCFGACKEGGDLFSFVMKQQNMDFGEALRLLAPKAGVQLEPPRQRDSEQQKQLDKLLDIHAAAALYYHETLTGSPKGAPGRAYADKRGLNEETRAKFQVGFSVDAWRALSNDLLERGYRREDLLEAGLIIARDDGGFYDRFRGRLMVPIRDIRGRAIGFGGRIIGRGEPKYLNSPQTPLFNKSHVLFGLDLAKGAIRAKGYVVIVEGYMDVLQAHQAGIGNVVASMGTALTEHQLGLLKRLTKRYVLALDPDLAGDQATLRGLAVARQTLDRQTVPVPTARGYIRYESRLDADIRIMTLPQGQDPDDVIRETPELWDSLVEAAIPVVDYYFELTIRDLDMTTAKGKAEAVHRLAPILSEIRDEVERTHYIQKLARTIRVDESTVRRQLGLESKRQGRGTGARDGRSPRGHSQAAEQVELPSRVSGPAGFALEEHCLAALLRRPEFLAQIDALLIGLSLSPLQEDDFERSENRALYEAWLQLQEGQEWQAWVENLPQALQYHLDFLLERGLDADQLVGQDAERDIERRVLELRHRRINRAIQNLRTLQAESLDQGDAKASEHSYTTMVFTAERARLERALYERTATGKREKRERVV